MWSLATTSNRTGHSFTWRSRRKACAVRTSTWCFSLLMLNSGCAGLPAISAGAHLHKRQRLAVKTHQAAFALFARRLIIPGDKHVSLQAQVPIGIRFAAHAHPQVFLLAAALPGAAIVAQASP